MSKPCRWCGVKKDKHVPGCLQHRVELLERLITEVLEVGVPPMTMEKLEKAMEDCLSE